MTRDQAFEDWIDKARGVKIRAELGRRGLWSRRLEGDAGNPCPGCGGRDRFAVNQRKNIFICRKGDAAGGAIALVMHIDNVSFLTAVETLTGEPPPGRQPTETQEQKRKREEAAIARARAEDAKRVQQADNERLYRERERREAYRTYLNAVPIIGTLAEDYLARRGVCAPNGNHLRFAASLNLFNNAGELMHKGPALVAGVRGPDGHFAGIERIWIDLKQPKGKALVADPKTGELVPAKKHRGSTRAGSVLLAKAISGPPRRLIMGEGIETTLSVYMALRMGPTAVLAVADTEFRAALSLGNLAGKAAAGKEGRVRHPTETRTDTRGHIRPVMVPSDLPAEPADDMPLIAIPDSVEELILLKDGDSEPFMTTLAMKRAAARFARGYPWLTIRVVSAAPDQDFNDEWLAQMARAA